MTVLSILKRIFVNPVYCLEVSLDAAAGLGAL